MAVDMLVAPPAVPVGSGSAGSSSGVGVVDVVGVAVGAGPGEAGAGAAPVGPVAVGLHAVVEPAQGREVPGGGGSAGVVGDEVVEVAAACRRVQWGNTQVGVVSTACS